MSATKSEILKKLKQRKSELTAEYELVIEEQRALTKRLVQSQIALQAIEREIKATSAAEPILTDHAILRFLERGKGVDMESIRNEILSSELRAKIKRLKSGRLSVPGGLLAVVENSVVVTIVRNNQSSETQP